MVRVIRLGSIAVGLILVESVGFGSGFSISGRWLFDANGNTFVMRGINHPHVWYSGQTRAFSYIRNAGANTIRVVLGSGQRWGPSSATDVANVIKLCKQNQLICILEVHDTMGYGEQSDAASLFEAVSYWQSIKNVLVNQEAYVIINIGNEPYGNKNTSNWLQDTINAVQAMRQAGFQHTLMIDAPNWGQDWQFIMRDNAQTIFNSDPLRNLIFSVHMYGVYDTSEKVQSYLQSFVNRNLPLIVGEFGWMHIDGDPDDDAIMLHADMLGIGYIGWSWSGNSGGFEYLDMVLNFDPNQLTSWGNRFINGANGLRNSPYSRVASVYSGRASSEDSGSGAGPEGCGSCSVSSKNSLWNFVLIFLTAPLIFIRRILLLQEKLK